MRLSRYFLPLLKEDPKEAQIVSHRLMLRAGMIKQQAAGIYSWLPMGYKVLRRIEQIVHEEQQRAGHVPLLMPTLQPASSCGSRDARLRTRLEEPWRLLMNLVDPGQE